MVIKSCCLFTSQLLAYWCLLHGNQMVKFSVLNGTARLGTAKDFPFVTWLYIAHARSERSEEIKF